MSLPLRPAKPSEAVWVHAQLLTALNETFGHVPEFVSREAARFSPDYLRALIAANPAHVFIGENAGKPAGFMLSGPEQGNLVYYWGYIEPASRKGGLAHSSMAQFVKHWDNGRFHKITAYTTAKNRVAQLLLQRNGFHLVAKLEKHILGQDFMQFERPLNKIQSGYDHTVGLGLKSFIKLRLKQRFGRT